MVVLDNISKIQNKVVQILDDTLNIDLSGMCSDADIIPDADFCDKDKKFVIDIDLPGVDIKDVEITYHADKLTVKGSRKGAEPAAKTDTEGESDISEEKYICQEISYGTFERSFDLPAEIDETHAKATYKNGVLSIAIPKTKPSESKLKKIKIEA